jgi:FMN phosphatase YigB (HAD superfamily)
MPDPTSTSPLQLIIFDMDQGEAALMVDDDADNVAGAEAAGLHGRVFDGPVGLINRLAVFGIGTI